MLDRARNLNGVRSAALAELLPLSNRAIADDFAPEDRPAQAPEQVFFTTVSPGYFATLGIPLVAGRDFTPEDRSGAPAVAVVNETLARRFWPGQSPLGRRFAPADRPGEGFEIVGVARDGKYLSLTEPARPFAYFALAQGAHLNENILLVRGSRGEALSGAVRAAARSLDPTMPLFQAETLEEALRRTTAGRRQGTLLLAGFGALALLLAAVGLYGVVAFAVGERRREIGIRMALGAARRDIVSLFVGRGARLAALGVAIGLVLASAITRLLSSMLFGVTPLDVTTLAAVSALLAAVALAASALPARRAARIDPASVLRND
jgi:putative ABC transport system permease protein